MTLYMGYNYVHMKESCQAKPYWKRNALEHFRFTTSGCNTRQLKAQFRQLMKRASPIGHAIALSRLM